MLRYLGIEKKFTDAKFNIRAKIYIGHSYTLSRTNKEGSLLIAKMQCMVGELDRFGSNFRKCFQLKNIDNIYKI